MTARNVRLVYQKEMRDTLRDRRTLFISIVLPILLYPLLMIGLSQVMMAAQSRIREKPQKIALTGLSGPFGDRVRAGLAEPERKLEIVDSVDPAAELRAGRIEAFVEAPEGFDATLDAGEQGAVVVHLDSTRDESQAADRKIREMLREFGTAVLRERGLSEADIEPVKVERSDAASTRQRGAKQFGPMLALLLVVMALTGAFYPAVDIMAGEKERGTMETLLVCPATRTEIVLGKYLTVFTMTVVTALLNFASMALTFSWFARMIPAQAAAGSMALEVSPSVGLVIVVALLPLAGLFAAAAIALSTFARSYKEGQHYLTPVFVGVMPLTMVALVPGTKLATFAAVPVAGVVLLVRDLLLESAGAAELLVVLATSALYAALAIWATVKMFNREDVLFRDPGGADFTLLRRATAKGEVPRPGQALGLAAVILVLIFFLMPAFQKMEKGTAAFFFVQFLGLLFLVPLIAARWYRLDLRKTFSLRMPRPAGWLPAILGAPALLAVLVVLLERAGVDEESMKPLQEEIRKLAEQIGLPLLVLLPPIVEEFFFRGFVLSGFRRGARNPLVAVATVAVLFGVFHLLPAKYLPTGIIGFWLGYLVIATGSLYPAILAHLANNALGLLLPPDFAPKPWMALAALPVLVLAVLIAEKVRRADARAAEGAPRGGGESLSEE